MTRNELVAMLKTDYPVYTHKLSEALARRASAFTGDERDMYITGYRSMHAFKQANPGANANLVLGAGQLALNNIGYKTFIEHSIYNTLQGVTTQGAVGHTPPAPASTPTIAAPQPAATDLPAAPIVAQAPVVQAQADPAKRVTVRLEDLSLFYTLLKDTTEAFSILAERLSLQDQITVGYKSADDTVEAVVVGSTPHTQGLVPTNLNATTAKEAAGKVRRVNAKGEVSWVTPAQAAATSPENMARIRAAAAVKRGTPTQAAAPDIIDLSPAPTTPTTAAAITDEEARLMAEFLRTMRTQHIA